jgi:hypothetical protein
MTQPKDKSVRITPKTDSKVLSAAQKRFNSLTKKIDSQKKTLLEWKETIPVYRQKVEQEYNVLVDTFDKYRAEMVQLFDQSFDNKLFKKNRQSQTNTSYLLHI